MKFFRFSSRSMGKDMTIPNCSLSKGEADIARILKEISIEFIIEYPVINPKTGHNLRYDFYLPKQNIFI